MQSDLSALGPSEAALLVGSRRAVLATLAGDGPRLVPITFAADLDASVIYSALDEKPKSVADPRRLARVRDILARPQVSVLVDEWSEDWRDLRWARIDGAASLLDPADPADAGEHAHAVRLLRDRYAQYAEHRLEDRPIIRIAVRRVVSWAAGG